MRVSGLFAGHVVHARGKTVANRFRYPVSFAGVDVDELGALDASLRLFSHNRRNVFALRDRDYEDAARGGLRDAVERLAGRSPDRIVLLTQLATVGFVFNPVSFFLCYDQRDELSFAIAEVNNTYGGTHRYLLDEACRSDEPGHVYRTRKQLYVSPYIDEDCEYVWTLSSRSPRDPIQEVHMRVLAEGRAFFAARLRGKRRVFSDISLATMGLRYPLMPQAVLSLIHLQALKLWTLGLQYRRPPEVVR